MKKFIVEMQERGKDGVVRTLKQEAICETRQQVIDWYGLNEPDIVSYKIMVEE